MICYDNAFLIATCHNTINAMVAVYRLPIDKF